MENEREYRILERFKRFEIQVKIIEECWFQKDKVRWVLCDIYGNSFLSHMPQSSMCPRFKTLEQAKACIDEWFKDGKFHYYNKGDVDE